MPKRKVISEHEDDDGVVEEKKKSTPEEKEEELPPAWTKWTAGSYAVVMLLLGLPLWWKTTAVQRVPLPYNDMSTLSDRLQSSFLIKIPVDLIGFAKVSPNDEIKFHNLEGHYFSISYNPVSPLEMDTIYKLSDIYQIDKEMCKLAANTSENVHPLKVYYVGRADFLQEHGQQVIIGNCRSFYYISNSSKIKFDRIWNVLRKISGFGQIDDGRDLIDLNNPLSSIEESLQLPLSAGYNILLSLLVPEPEILESKWEIEKAVNDFVNPMLSKMSSFAEFSVRSQILYYIRLNVYPKWNADEKYHEIPYEQLPLVINPVESKLTSFVSQNPVLNFLTYTSPCSKSPLQILEADGSPLSSNAFLVPQWGGIFIYNPPCATIDAVENKNATEESASNNKVHIVSTEQVMSVMISQFRSLVGLPEKSFKDILDFRGSALRDWEVDMLVRRRLRKLVFTAANTLHSLGQLLDEITNIVVTEEVGDQVEKSVSSIKSAIQEASQGNLDAAQSHAIEAFKSSEIAFHHPKNLKQLYFPDDQKYAIYIPLFLPVGLPVVLPIAMEIVTR